MLTTDPDKVVNTEFTYAYMTIQTKFLDRLTKQYTNDKLKVQSKRENFKLVVHIRNWQNSRHLES